MKAVQKNAFFFLNSFGFTNLTLGKRGFCVVSILLIFGLAFILKFVKQSVQNRLQF